MKIKFLILFLLFLSINASHALEKPEYDLYTHICLKQGIYFDSPSELNSILSENGYPKIEPGNVFYIGLNYSSNHFPFPFYRIPNIFLSFDLRIPFDRNSGAEKYSALKTYSVFLELEGYHDLINDITVYPILGLGASISHLDLRNDSIIDYQDILIKNGSARFTKFNLLLNLGGGLDYKIKITEDYLKKLNLLVGLNIRYSLNLDVFGLYDKRWSSAGKSIDGLPGYHAPGLSIELKIGLEKLEKIKRIN
ncbi:MAG: hypothetical protein HZB41_05970 [Ignavibacteriae bacterium]|nr:hypothetical protein [Ignavibacteriota bacterium]